MHELIQIGVDTGGTFTDFVMVCRGQVLTYKLASTPPDFSIAILEGIRALIHALPVGGQKNQRTRPAFSLVHSSTVATNALLERNGARTALITTKGFRDVIEIGRQERGELYNLKVRRPEPLVPRALRAEVTERISSEGRALVALSEKEVDQVLSSLLKKRVESLAVCLLFSFLKPTHERLIAKCAKRHGLAVSVSSEIMPEFREFERTSTTVANAYVAPKVQRYLENLLRDVKRAGGQQVRVMQSNGGSLSARTAGEQAAHTLLSGPAAGVIGARAVARQALENTGPQNVLKLITFDMGGTSTDVSLLNGDLTLRTAGNIGGLPVHLPMIDIHTVGAGGGSLARTDPGGALCVGPQSAGAHPGPACYGVGGEPTVTDANLVLGRMDPRYFLDGRMKLEPRRANAAVGALARRLGMNTPSAARAVLRIVNSNMERAIRVISVERGYDPREFTLVSFGGAGGLHACDLADSLRIPRVLIPCNPGVLSAWGALSADVVKDYSRTVMLPFDTVRPAALDMGFSPLLNRAQRDLTREGFARRNIVVARSLDLRYAGQSYELNVPMGPELQSVAEAFHAEHQKRYGHHARGEPLEIVTARVRACGHTAKPVLEPLAWRPGKARSPVLHKRRSLTVYDRALFQAEDHFEGPALVVESFATTYVPRGWAFRVDTWGNLHLKQ